MKIKIRRKSKSPRSHDIWGHFRLYIFRGILASIPLGLSIFIIRFFYVAIDRKIVGIIHGFIGFRIPGLGILLVLVLLYLIGLLASNIIGKRIFHFFEQILNRIPLIKSVYQVGKQLSVTLSLPEREVFKRVVLVDCFKPGCWLIGFVTGTMINKKTGEKMLKVLVPNVPNPATGFLMILSESQVIDPGLSIEEGIKMTISGGIISPEQLGITNRPL